MHIHPLEHNDEQRLYFERIRKAAAGTGAAAYRKAVLACVGWLPSWAEKARPGPQGALLTTRK